MVACMLGIQDRWIMYKEIKEELRKLKGKEVLAIIDEGRSRKKEEKVIIKDVYDNVFLIEMNGINTSFGYSDVICKTIVFKNI